VESTRLSPIDVLGARRPGVVVSRPAVDERHITEVLAAYDRAITFAETAAEARVRKAWMLHRLDRHDEALVLLDAPGDEADVEVSYLRQLFRGRVLDAMGRAAEARDAYRRAYTLVPTAQSARVALIRHAAMVGDTAEAASLSEAVLTDRESGDPWWGYWQADFRMVPGALARMREQVR
jgi:tetratricopeptide (TPR) repeat protein